MTEQELRQRFKNNSDCYADSDDVIQAMSEDAVVAIAQAYADAREIELQAEIKRLREGIELATREYAHHCDAAAAQIVLIELLSHAPVTESKFSSDIDTIGNCANCGVEFHIHKIEPVTEAPKVDENGTWIGDMSNSFDQWLRLLKKGELTIRKDHGMPFKVKLVDGVYESNSFSYYDLNDVIDWVSTRGGLEFFHPKIDKLDENGLLPCPHCGGSGRVKEARGWSCPAYEVVCDDCRSRSFCTGHTDEDVKQAAIEKWNKRV